MFVRCGWALLSARVAACQADACDAVRLNVEKTKVLPIGAAPPGLPPTAHGLQVVSEATSLGVTFGTAPDPTAAANRWQQLLEGVHACWDPAAALV